MIKNLKDSKILLIGGAGFVGSHTARELLEHNPSKITIFDNISDAKQNRMQDVLDNPKVELFDKNASILYPEMVEAACCGVDIVYHFPAVWFGVAQKDPDMAYRVNVEGLKNVLSICSQKGIQKFVFASSVAVYGEQEVLPIPETASPNGDSVYGATKIAGEALVKAYAKKYNFGYYILRYANIFGSDQIEKSGQISVVERFRRQARDDGRITVYGDGSQKYDFIEISNVAIVNCRVLEKESGVYNIGTGKATSILELATKTAKEFGVDVVHVSTNQKQLQDLLPDVSKITSKDSLE